MIKEDLVVICIIGASATISVSNFIATTTMGFFYFGTGPMVYRITYIPPGTTEQTYHTYTRWFSMALALIAIGSVGASMYYTGERRQFFVATSLILAQMLSKMDPYYKAMLEDYRRSNRLRALQDENTSFHPHDTWESWTVGYTGLLRDRLRDRRFLRSIQHLPV